MGSGAVGHGSAATDPRAQTVGDGPQAVPGELVCRCACPRGYFTRQNPTVPSGSATYTRVAIAAVKAWKVKMGKGLPRSPCRP